MARVKVWNDNEYPHTEMFKGDKIHIEPHAFIEMDYEEANEFKGQFTGIRRLGDERPDPRYFKKIRIEGKPPPPPDAGLICMADGSQAATKEDLAKLLEKFSGIRVAPERTETASDTETLLKAAMARIEALEAKEAHKKKLGRPFKKEAVG